MASNATPGLILMMNNEYTTLEEMRQEAQAGINDGQGTALSPVAGLSNLSNTALAGVFKGTLEGTPVKAYVIGLLNPNGSGVSIMSVTTPEQYGEAHQQAAEALYRSVAFYKPKVPPVVDQWRQNLQDVRLTYMSSYSSNSYGSYGGSNSKTVIDLCAQGYFTYYRSSSLSIDVGGAFGNSSGQDDGQGKWQVVANASNQPVLRLNFDNGEVYEYVLSMDGNKTMLNGNRYFRTTKADGEHAPRSCY
jgi:hypothetical protein